jgi:hypothetical protein
MLLPPDSPGPISALTGEVIEILELPPPPPPLVLSSRPCCISRVTGEVMLTLLLLPGEPGASFFPKMKPAMLRKPPAVVDCKLS